MRLPALLALACAPLVSFAELPLVPLPAVLEEKSEAGFVLTSETVFVATGDAAKEAEQLAATLRASTGLPLSMRTTGMRSQDIRFNLDASLKDKLGAEGYRLESGPFSVRIVAADTAGLFYAGRTLLQLLPPDALSKTVVPGVKWTVPAVKITDSPRFGWRGFMLDESRHFFGVDYVKRLLDAMALHKLNRFHWHLSDDDGWRIEIKAYPKLTDIGAWRGTACAIPDTRDDKLPRYGGFYTQAQLREIVAYAKARHIEIMPEVDLPGHSLAIVTAYPELLPDGQGEGVSAQGFRSNVVSPAKPGVYKFVETVFDELATIFPYGYIHIGGDEVNHDAWKNAADIKALMQREKLGNYHEVQVYFTRRLEKIFAARGKRIFGWNEILDDRLDKNTGIMTWISTGPGYHAAKKGFPVVMAAGQHTYFDMPYGGAQGEPPAHWWAGDVPVSRVYAFDPLGDGGDLSPAAKEKILGVHGALWTEFVKPWKGDVLDLPTGEAHADYKIWPRLAALAEVGWTPQARRKLDDFEARLGPVDLSRLGHMGVNYRVPTPTAGYKSGKLTLRPPFPGAEVRYTMDGTIPTENSPRYEAPIALAGRDPGRLRARTFLSGRASTMLAGAKAEGSAEWNAKKLAKAGATTEFDVSADLNAPGIWRATFVKTGGKHALKISGVELLVNGAVVASDAHEGVAGGKEPHGTTYRFVAPAIPAGAKVSLRAKLSGDGGDNVSGIIVLNKSERLEPVAKVVTKLGHYGSDTPEKAADWDDGTKYWIDSQPAAGDTVTWEFAEPVAAKSVGLLTGERSGTKDQAVGATLEYTTDGTSWKQIADFTYGRAEGALPAGTALKALRLRFTENQKTWIIVNDPELK